MNEIEAALRKVRRKVARERTRARKIEKAAWERNDSFARERARGEDNVLTLAISFIDDAIKESRVAIPCVQAANGRATRSTD